MGILRAGVKERGKIIMYVVGENGSDGMERVEWHDVFNIDCMYHFVCYLGFLSLEIGGRGTNELIKRPPGNFGHKFW